MQGVRKVIMDYPDIDLTQSKRFQKNYRSASPPLQKLAVGAIRDFVRRHRSDRRTVSLKYDKLAHMSDVLEIDIADGPRLLARYLNGELQLLSMGKHNQDFHIHGPHQQWLWSHTSDLYIGDNMFSLRQNCTSQEKLGGQSYQTHRSPEAPLFDQLSCIRSPNPSFIMRHILY